MNESLSPREASSIMSEGNVFMDQSIWSLERRRIETLDLVLILTTTWTDTEAVSPSDILQRQRRGQIKFADFKMVSFRSILCNI
jgi:hypothetical protein